MTKLSISRAWDESRAVLARDGKLIGTVALALFVFPGIILNLIMPTTRSSGSEPNPWLLVALIPILISLVGQLSIIRLAMGPHISVGEAIAHGGRRILYYAGAVLVWTVPFMLIGSFLYTMVGKDPQHPSAAAAIGLLIVTAIGVFLAVRFILISAVASAEPVGPIAILRRSWDLTTGNWWRLFAFLLLCMVAAMILLVAVQSVAALIARMVFGDVSSLSVGGLLVSIAGQLVSGVISVILFVMLARIYVQLARPIHADVGVPNSGI